MAFSVRGHRNHIFALLQDVEPRLRAVFAACCAERLLPYFVAVNTETRRSDPNTIGGALDWFWESLEKNEVEELAARRFAADCKRSIVEEGISHRYAFAAADCAAAATYGMMAATSHKAEDAGWAGTRVIDSIHRFLVGELFGRGRVVKIGPEQLKEIVEHSLFQAEVNRQLEDLAELKGAPADLVATLRRMRDRSRQAALSMFSV